MKHARGVEPMQRVKENKSHLMPRAPPWYCLLRLELTMPACSAFQHDDILWGVVTV